MKYKLNTHNKYLLIDADSTIPNIALGKLSTYFKNQKHQVDFLKLNISYYPNRKKKRYFIKTKNYSAVFCSVIFEKTIDYIYGKDIIFGGTGYDLQTKLSSKIECLEVDYSLYPENDCSYGFISRGCIRNCYFCKVPEKEGGIKQVSTINSIIKHKKVKFLDNNFLALPNHKSILQELVDKKIKCNFNQGLDIRLLDKENSNLLSKLNYLGEYTFAFDSWHYRKLIEKKLKLLSWRNPFQIRFFVYCHPKMQLSSIVKRILFLKQRECLPYIMRDFLCFNDKNCNFYTDVASYCNQPGIFKNLSFNEFIKRRFPKNKLRVFKSKVLFYQNL